ncbi:MAG TPA: hypothetical protein VF391_07255 [Dermatophilaceae bacterium]|jgi:hypothetical protein
MRPGTATWVTGLTGRHGAPSLACALPALPEQVAAHLAMLAVAHDEARHLLRNADGKLRPGRTENYDRARGTLNRHGLHFLTAYVAGV